MLFKLFTLFSMLTLGLNAASVDKRHYYGSHVQQPWNYGYGGLLGQTVTVTLTETQHCTSPPTPTETKDKEKDKSTDDDDDDSDDLDSQEHCLYLFNQLRKSQNLPLFESATDKQIACADKAAAYDASAGYHASFYGRICPGNFAQVECMKNVGIDLPNFRPEDPLYNCIEAYIAEYTLGKYPQEGLGHWKIITDPKFRSVACGTDGNGFYTHNLYN